MPTYMRHKEHGIHICYTPEDVEKHRAIGWVPTDEFETKRVEIADPVEVTKKRGRPKKVGNGNRSDAD